MNKLCNFSFQPCSTRTFVRGGTEELTLGVCANDMLVAFVVSKAFMFIRLTADDGQTVTKCRTGEHTEENQCVCTQRTIGSLTRTNKHLKPNMCDDILHILNAATI